MTNTTTTTKTIASHTFTGPWNKDNSTLAGGNDKFRFIQEITITKSFSYGKMRKHIKGIDKVQNNTGYTRTKNIWSDGNPERIAKWEARIVMATSQDDVCPF